MSSHHSHADTEHTTDFTVHPGPSHLHAPLGHADVLAHDHYIKPTPHFTTEYEAAYDNPPPLTPSRSARKPEDPWKQMESALQKMIDCKFEVILYIENLISNSDYFACFLDRYRDGCSLSDPHQEARRGN